MLPLHNTLGFKHSSRVIMRKLSWPGWKDCEECARSADKSEHALLDYLGNNK
jgi:hypothetical protein